MTGPARPDFQRVLEMLKAKRTEMLDEVVTVEPSFYTDPEIARLERERVFGRAPVPVVHASEIGEPGDFITTRLPNNAVIVARGQDGQAHAFLNVCRHRGSTVETEAKGSRRRFQCPYHGWSYNLDGSLKSATHEVSFGKFDHIEHGLTRLPVEERHGMVWVVDNPHASIDVAEWLGSETDAALASYEMDEHVCVHADAFEAECNWKVLQDAFLDGYHIQFVHKETAAKMTYTNIMTLDDFGRHSRILAPRKSITKMFEEHGDDLTDEQIRPHVHITHGITPNCTVLNLPDHVQVLTFYPHPGDHARSRMELRMIVPTAEDSGREPERWQEYWDRNWQISTDILRDEDMPIAKGVQDAVSSHGAQPLLLGRNEVANQVFHREINLMLQDAGGES